MELRADESLPLTAFAAANAAEIRPGKKNRWKTDGEPTETALLIAAAQGGTVPEAGGGTVGAGV